MRYGWEQPQNLGHLTLRYKTQDIPKRKGYLH